MAHSLKYDYYKLTGAGIEEMESKEEALIRKIKLGLHLYIKSANI